MILHRIILLLAGLLITIALSAQADSISPGTISSKYLSKISSRTDVLVSILDRRTVNAMAEMEKLENRFNQKLVAIDSAKGREAVERTKELYSSFRQQLQEGLPSNYIASLDTFKVSIQFLKQHPEYLSSTKEISQKLETSLAKVKELETQFQKADEVKRFLKERQQSLSRYINQAGLAKQSTKINKHIYYYSEQIKQYKDMLKDHSKAERKAIELLARTKTFQNFMRKNSQLASLFRLPGDPVDPAQLAGLQTRAQVNNIIQQQLATGGADARQQFSQNLQEAQSQITELKNKLNQYGQGSSDDIMPQGFKPNNQKSKSIWQRLELGTNIQSQKNNGYFPVTSDLGLSLGYKLSDKSIIGLGASYKLGWGKNIRNINITHQGVGLRSFLDVKIKGSFWINGGYEMNYRNEFNRVDVLKDLDAWQQSGLLGVSKVISLKTKFFKNTKLQFLWDFLSYQQVPRAQPIVFRVGYNF